MAVILDTCAWIWYATKPDQLSRPAAEAIQLEKSRSGIFVCVISVWEVAKLVEKGKLRFSIPCGDWIDQAMRLEGITLQPLTPEICIASTQLPGAFHGDPADQIIVATARSLSLPVITSDRGIRRYAHVASLW